ncbi:MAG: site-2 protease family protein, partial [Desulfitobacterium hafniense]|nr:site-2 protease family protein [Desulfitobacterium hafniense]
QDTGTGNGMIGIAPQIVYEKASLWKSAAYGLERTVDFTKFILLTFMQMITRQVPADVGGPVAIAQAIGEGAEQGWASLLGLTGILSIQLGLINLFPIPALDGSRLVFLLVEGVRGKPLKPERENFIHMIGFVLLLALMLAITYQDVLKLFVNKG